MSTTHSSNKLVLKIRLRLIKRITRGKLIGNGIGVEFMTISKKVSRKITIGREVFRWVISPSSKGVIVLTVHHEEVSGQIIRVYIESDINEYWVEFPNVESLNNKVVKPSEVASIITEAMKQGWNPKKKGTPISFAISKNNLVPR